MQNFLGDNDFLRTSAAGLGCERYADGVADTLLQQYRQGRCRGDDALGTHAGFGEAQVQGSLWITGWDWWDEWAYNPDPKMKQGRTRTYPSSEWQKALDEHLGTFKAQLRTAWERWERMGARGRDDHDLMRDLEASVEAMYGPELVK